jgi:5,10-methylenetetrahydromethanopterin reductase
MLAGTRPAREAISVAREAEQAGIDELWVPEDYFERGGFTMAAAIATATTRAKVGVGVVNPWTRHPLLIAMEFAALDELADGRAILGLGASNRVWMQERAGIPFSAPLAAVFEGVHIIKEALAGEHVAFTGRHFTVDAALSFAPPRPHPPIYVGAKGRRALGMTGERADGVLLSLLSAPGYITWAREQIKQPLDVTAYVLAACKNDRAEARESVRHPLAFYLGVHGDHDITRVAGLDAEICARFRTGWLTGQPARELVDDTIIDTFAVAGDLDDCLAGLHRLDAAGLDCAVLRDPGDATVNGLLGLATAYAARTGGQSKRAGGIGGR